MGLFSKKNRKLDQSKSGKKGTDIELTEEELDKVTAGVPSANNNRDWCPKVKVEPINIGELTEEELDEVKAGVPKINDER